MNPFASPGGGAGVPEGLARAQLDQQLQEQRAQVFAAKLEFQMSREAQRKMLDVCFRRCITTWQEPELTKGEGLCTDRCVSKFFKVLEIVNARQAAIMEKMQEDQETEERIMKEASEKTGGWL